jgi:hypothetical protein
LVFLEQTSSRSHYFGPILDFMLVGRPDVPRNFERHLYFLQYFSIVGITCCGTPS